MKAFYQELKEKTPFAKQVKDIVLGSAGALAMFGANPAFAEGELANKPMPGG